MLECEKCRYPNNDDASKCINCGLLINISIHDQPKKGLFERLNNSRMITEKDWTNLLFLMLIPLFNLYIIIRYGYINKNESTIRNFLRSVATVFVGIITFLFVSKFMESFFNYST